MLACEGVHDTDDNNNRRHTYGLYIREPYPPFRYEEVRKAVPPAAHIHFSFKTQKYNVFRYHF
jgi:hypothetical protein